MPRGSAYQNRKKSGLNKSVQEDNARYPKAGKPVSKAWAAGGHAPQGKPSPGLAKRVLEYLKRTGQLK